MANVETMKEPPANQDRLLMLLYEKEEHVFLLIQGPGGSNREGFPSDMMSTYCPIGARLPS